MRALIALVLCACTPDDDPTDRFLSPLLDIEETETWKLPGLQQEAYVVRVEAGVPYIYAKNREDLALLTGFVLARDRFFMMDMIRRLGQGRLSEWLGDEALSADIEARGIGMDFVAGNVLEGVSADPELSAMFDAYARGINAYIDEVNSNRLPVPSEIDLLGPILAGEDAKTLLQPWNRRDVAAVAAVFTYQLGFETTDQGRDGRFAALEDLYAGAAAEDLRRTGVLADVRDRHEPVFPVASAPGWSAPPAPPPPARLQPRPRLFVPAEVLQRLDARMRRLEERWGHDRESGWGSNAWAVAGSHSADGRALLAGDGHLPMTVPSFFYQIGLDTEHLAADGTGTHQVGLTIPGMPLLAVGTNGMVAWSQTQLFGDITDWYREELQLDANGAPAASLFQGAWEPLVETVETYEVRDIPLLDSVGRTETWSHWQTFDGRWISEIEGRSATADEVLAAGETLVNLQGELVVPSDTDGDGVVTAISFDYTGFDRGNMPRAVHGFADAVDVYDFQEQTKRLVAYSQSITVADSAGHVLYTGYQAVPCRSYLPRHADGTWMDGADPTRLIDGTTYGGFTIPVDSDGFVDESQGADPYRCVVPFEANPQQIDPGQGYVLTANNDPGGASLDGTLANDPWYVGGPWLEGFRAHRIDVLLADATTAGWADLDGMAAIQGDHHSNVGLQYLPVLFDALDAGRTAAQGAPAPGSAEERIAALFTGDQARFEAVEQRLQAWWDAELPARSGVKTAYDPVLPGDEAHAVATTLFNAWVGRFFQQVLDDEGFSGAFYPTGDTGRTRTMTRLLDGRGAGNPLGLASWDPATEESAFFDLLGTPEVETSDELALSALTAALDFLESDPVAFGEGGFGTADMDAWLWGLRHMARFESLLSEFLDADDDFGFLIEVFSITPDVVPIDDDITPGDIRGTLPWFPRHGDHLNVDAGNSGFGGSGFSYGSGPVFRMVIALGPDGVEGRNVVPGGQSGLTTSEFFADQAGLWLGNDTLPLRWTVDEVIAGATARERYLPRL